MKVLCKSSRPTESQVVSLGFESGINHVFTVSQGSEYTVLGLTILAESPYLGRGTVIHIVDDSGRWSLAPLCIFEISDERLSGHWLTRQLNDTTLALWPKSFFRPYYHEDLADNDPEVVEDFEQVKRLIFGEYANE